MVDAFLVEGCTLLVPTFTYDYGLVSQPGMRPERNGWKYNTSWEKEQPAHSRIFLSSWNEIHESMGAIPKAVLQISGRARGSHPLCSFSAVGPLAVNLVAEQTLMDVNSPLKKISENAGEVVLIGVGLNRMTLLHFAEEAAGRNMFIRWANDQNGRLSTCNTGGCSDGFGKLEPCILPVKREIRVGKSIWSIFPGRETLDLASRTIKDNPEITHCGNLNCDRCNDAVKGGPVLHELRASQR